MSLMTYCDELDQLPTLLSPSFLRCCFRVDSQSNELKTKTYAINWKYAGFFFFLGGGGGGGRHLWTDLHDVC